MTQDAINDLWRRWLYRYWKDRIKGVPAKLEESEVAGMLGWLVHLGELYPEAIDQAKLSGSVSLLSSSIFYELRESDLVIHYQNETAELLIYLCTCKLGHHVIDIVKISERLTSLPYELRKQLDESIARLGV